MPPGLLSREGSNHCSSSRRRVVRAHGQPQEPILCPHLLACRLWGERLVTLNLLSDTVLSFQPPADSPGPALEIAVPLPRYSLVVVQGAARHTWTHAIHRHDITERRIAVTLRCEAPSQSLTLCDAGFGCRELTPLFTTGERAAEGQALLQVARTYQGNPM